MSLKSLFCFASILIWSAMSFAGESKMIVFFCKEGNRNNNLWKTENYGIKIKRYDNSNIKNGFTTDLKNAGMLVFSTNSAYYDAGKMIIDPKYRQAIKDFLKNGGTVFFNYKGFCFDSNSKMRTFLKGVGVDGPSMVWKDYAPVKVASAVDCKLVKKTNDLKKIRSDNHCSYGYFKNVSPKTKVILTRENQKDCPVLLMQENVLGNGRVIFSNVVALQSGEFQETPKNHSFSIALMENLFHLVFENLMENQELKQSATKKRTVLHKSPVRGNWTKNPVTKLNYLYFRNMLKKPWWNNKWTFRLPVLVRETMGKERQEMPVSVKMQFPPGIKVSSFRTLTPEWLEIPSQARLVEKEENVFEITFTSNFLANETKCFFIYFDDASKATPNYKTLLFLSEDKDYYILGNEKIKAKIRKDLPIVSYISPLGNPTGNQFHNQYDFLPDSAGMTLNGLRRNNSKFKVQILENGPIRKVIKFEGVFNNKPLSATFSLYKASRRLGYLYSSPKQMKLNRHSRWLPGKGRDRDFADRFYFCANESIKDIGIEFMWYGHFLKKLSGHELDEGWYAIEDTATRQIAGEVMDLENIESIQGLVHTFEYAHEIQFVNKLSPTRDLNGGIVSLPANSNALDMREEYLKFKNPPETAVAEIQKRDSVPSEWQVPVYGKDLIRSYLLTHRDIWTIASFPKEFFDDKFMETVHKLKSIGCNYISIWHMKPCWENEFAQGIGSSISGIMKKAKKELGLGWEVCTTFSTLKPKRFLGEKYPSAYNGDYLQYKDIFAKVAAEVGKYAKPDIYLPMDEACYRIKKDNTYAIKLFRKKYGMDPVFKVDPDKLSEPAQHNTVLFQMDAYTKLLKTMAEAARNNDKSMFVGDQINPSSMTRLQRGAPHDWEKHSDFLNTISMDLYNSPRVQFKYYVKLMRSMFDNKGPIMMYQGCTTPAKQIIANQNYPLMWGIDAMFLFRPRGFMDFDFLNEVKRNYQYLDYTGIGDMLVTYSPLKRIALFRDRAGMINDIKKGRWTNRGSVYDSRIQNMTYLKNLQTDIVMSKYFTFENLKDYPILLVTSNPVISDKFAEVIREYVENGGCAILEGETLNNPILQKLAGIRSSGDKSEFNGKLEGQNGFTFAGEKVEIKNAEAKSLYSFANGSPILLEKTIGKGCIYAIPPLLSSKADSQNDIAAFYKALFDDISPQILRIRKNDQELVDSGIMTDGENYVLSVYNQSFEDKHVTFNWNGNVLPEITGCFSTGTQNKFTGMLEINIPRGQITHYFLGKERILELPRISEISRVENVSFSRDPESGIVTLRSLKQEQTSKKRPEKAKGYSYIAVLTDNGNFTKDAPITGDNAIFNSLYGRDGLKVEFITDINLDTLTYYDAVIVPNIGCGKAALPYALLGKDWMEILREYVKKGGSVLINHRGVGYIPCDFPPFPEVGVNAIAGVNKIRDMEIVSKHPISNGECWKKRFPAKAKNPAFQEEMDYFVLKPGNSFRIGFCDYVPIKPSTNTETIVRSKLINGKGGDPVVVAGTLGKGKVVLCGMSLGWNDGKEEMNKTEEKILINSAYWMTEKK